MAHMKIFQRCKDQIHIYIGLFGYLQGRIQDLKKEGAQGVRGLAPKIFLANLGDFSKNLAQKGMGVRPLRPPSRSAPDLVISLG